MRPSAFSCCLLDEEPDDRLSPLRAWHAGANPHFQGCHKRFVRKRWNRPVLAGGPRPEDERIRLHVFDDLFACAMAPVPRGVLHLLADLHLGPAFPLHGQGGEVPGRYTRHKAVGAVGRLMARLARLGGHPVAIFSTNDQRSMDRGGVRLPGRLVLMAVHAPWMHDDTRDRVERRRLCGLCHCTATRGEPEDDDDRSNPCHWMLLTPNGVAARAAACVSACPSPRRPRSPLLVP